MTHSLKLIVVSIALMCLTTFSLQAAPLIFSWGSEKIVKVKDLPYTADFQNDAGVHIDAGAVTKQICIFWMPVFNYDKKYCGYTGSDSQYYSVDESAFLSAARSQGVDLPDTPDLPFWDWLGGKLVVLTLFILWGKMQDQS